ncbi:hypothetical protein MAP00_000815 [Monascus purpureus]|nr:hypothetical protein MAP00_000815 [Monascus purpureus]
MAEDLDTAMTSGPGLQWALIGLFMNNALGGGGDFKHFLNHIGPAASRWLDDINERRFDFTRENMDRLAENVEGWTGTVYMKSVEKERDQYLVDLVKSKGESKHLK